MAARLAEILGLASSDKATVEVILFDLGAYFVSDANFTLLELRIPGICPLVFVDGQGG
jgi:hypothetical protein